MLQAQRRLNLPGLAAPLKAMADARGKLDAARSAAGAAPEGLAKVFVNQTRFATAVVQVLDAAVDASGLSLDPEANSYFAMDAAMVALPHLAEIAGRLQALSSASSLGGQGERTVAALWALQARTAAALDDMLAGRSDSLQRDAWRTAALVVGCVAVAAYLLWAFYLVMRGGLRQVSRQLGVVGQGDLSQAVVAIGNDEVADLLRDIDAMRLRLADTLRAMRRAAETVAVSSQQLAMGTGDLSQRTEQAAARLERSASAMDEMRASVDHTTASTAPSIIAAIELRYCSFVYSVRVNRILKSTLGLFFLISASFFIVSSWTVTSDEPFAFSIEKLSTCLPPIFARLRCSA